MKEREVVEALTGECGRDLEVFHQSQASASSSAQPSTCKIEQVTIAHLSTQVAQAYKET